MKESKEDRCLFTERPLYPTWFRWKLWCHSKRTMVLLLYIPHGSDERGPWAGSNAVTKAALYPTWFRWKLTGFYKFLPNPLPLYPTWFRWKVYFDVSGLPLSVSLYPTWFRWKRSPASSNTALTQLYIPHGSDESCYFYEDTYEIHNFISHMVQMKDAERICYGLAKPALYPTWFRWKRRRQGRVCRQRPSLYPTWFRWKFSQRY